MCCEADWKREVVQDHKWDYVNVAEFHKTNFMTRLKYVLVYVFLLKNVAVYGLDIFTAVTMIGSNHWTNSIYSKCGDNCAVPVEFNIAKWVFVGCIIFSFLLLAYETHKAYRVIQSRDISYSFTNLMANDYYSLRNYDNFCLFCHINSSTKRKDDFAFWIFFTFKGWKRLLLADGPRQSINAIVLYSFAYANGFETSNIPAYWDDSAVTAMLLFAMILTVLIFAGSLILLIAAAVLYMPLLCYIQGNLKEYVCHKVDKRIAEIIKRVQRERIKRNAALEKKLAQGGAIKSGRGDVIGGEDLLQPTLPDVKLDDDDIASTRSAPFASRNLGPLVVSPVAGGGRRSPVGMSAPDHDDGLYPGPPPTTYDIMDAYGYPPQPHGAGPYDDPGASSSTTGLVAAAAAPGLSYPPSAAAPGYPPSQAYGANYPPTSYPAYARQNTYASASSNAGVSPGGYATPADYRSHADYLDYASSAGHASGPGMAAPPMFRQGSAASVGSGAPLVRSASPGLAYDDVPTPTEGVGYGHDYGHGGGAGGGFGQPHVQRAEYGFSQPGTGYAQGHGQSQGGQPRQGWY